nr:HAMP domain-containing sensor histidine kinase [Sedimentibacter sp.]
MKFSLKIKLIFSYVLISLLLVGSLFFTTKYMFNTQFEKYVKTNLDKNSIQIVNQVTSAYDNKGNPPNDLMLKNIGEAALSKGLILSINNKHGEMIWCMNWIDQQMCSRMLIDIEQNMNNIYLDFDGEYMEESYDINKNGTSYGTITLGYYGPFYFNNDDVFFLNMFNQIFSFGAILAFLLAIILGIFMASRIGRPIKEVIENTAKIEGGDYNSLIEFKSNTKEVDKLIYSINSLASTLNRQHAIRKRLAQNYAHELRTPLASLQSNLEAMIDGIWEPNKERLESCNEEILRLTRMLSGIDKIAEIEDSSIALNKSTFNLLELANRIVLNFESYYKEKNIDLTVEGDSCNIYADKDKIGQVLINLLSNAIKYTQEYGSILVSIISKNDEVEFSVIDNGIGIDKEDLPNIFEHLYRTDKSRASATGGSGMGLAVVKAIVEAHQGKITVESEIGCNFTIILPKLN